MNNLGIALELLFVGMVTVFIILFLVILIGNLIIRFVNKYVPEDVETVPVKAKISATDSAKLAAIAGSVKAVTKGAGNITKIEKL